MLSSRTRGPGNDTPSEALVRQADSLPHENTIPVNSPETKPMHFFNQIENWPVVAICVGMLAAAIIDWAIFKVPNKLTFPLIFAGWALGLAVSFGWVHGYNGGGGFLAAFALTFVGLGLILPIYAIGGMGAGDCKMTMGFG